MSSGKDSIDEAYDLSLFSVYMNLKNLIKDSVSETGSGWARKRLNLAFQLHDIVMQLSHWLTDIGYYERAPLDTVERHDKAFASVIRTNLVFAQVYVRKLRESLEKSTNESADVDVEFEAALIEDIRTSVRVLQQQVEPLRIIDDAWWGMGTPSAIERAVRISPPEVHKVAEVDSRSPQVSDWSPDQDEVKSMEQFVPPATTEARAGAIRVIDMVRESALKNKDRKRFWPTRLLFQLMPRENVLRALEEEFSGLADNRLHGLADAILPRAERESQNAYAGFLKVFVILLLIGKGICIERFIALGLGDSRLPLFMESKAQRAYLFDSEFASTPISAFDGWKTFEIELFFQTQWQVLTPEVDPKHLQVLRLDRNTILPWLSLENGSYDMFGSVHKARIHQTSLSSDNTLLTHVAIKILYIMDTTIFEKEVRALVQVNSFESKNSIKLLGAQSLGYQHVLIFPWAKSNLGQYWKTHPGPLETMKRETVGPSEPKHTWEDVEWVSEQLRGIADALATMHDASVEDRNPPSHYIHCDLKPTHLLLMAEGGCRGRLVIGYRGVARVFDEHYSRIAKIYSRTSAYRPPELDIKDAPKSSLFDIWLLGCVFSEMICWMLGGNALRANFEQRRITVDPNGSPSFTFFEIISVHDYHIARIKPAVTQMFNDLRELPQCTPYVRVLLDLVQHDMLVVTSEVKQRIQPKELARKLAMMHDRVDGDILYATGPVTDSSWPQNELPPPVKVVPR